MKVRDIVNKAKRPPFCLGMAGLAGAVALGCEATPGQPEFTLEDLGRFGLGAAAGSVASDPNATYDQRRHAAIAQGIANEYARHGLRMREAREGRGGRGMTDQEYDEMMKAYRDLAKANREYEDMVNLCEWLKKEEDGEARQAKKDAFLGRMQKNILEGRISKEDLEREEAVLLPYARFVNYIKNARTYEDYVKAARELREIRENYRDTRFYAAHIE